MLPEAKLAVTLAVFKLAKSYCIDVGACLSSVEALGGISPTYIFSYCKYIQVDAQINNRSIWPSTRNKR